MNETKEKRFEELRDIPDEATKGDDLEFDQIIDVDIDEEDQDLTDFESIRDIPGAQGSLSLDIEDDIPDFSVESSLSDEENVSENQEEEINNASEIDLSDIGSINLSEAEKIASEDVFFLDESDLLEEFDTVDVSGLDSDESFESDESDSFRRKIGKAADFQKARTNLSEEKVLKRQPLKKEELSTMALPSENAMDTLFRDSEQKRVKPVKSELKKIHEEKPVPEAEKKITPVKKVSPSEEIIDIDVEDFFEKADIVETVTDDQDLGPVDDVISPDVTPDFQISELEEIHKEKMPNKLRATKVPGHSIFPGPEITEKDEKIDIVDLFWEQKSADEEAIHDDDFIQEDDILWDDSIRPVLKKPKRIQELPVDRVQIAEEKKFEDIRVQKSEAESFEVTEKEPGIQVPESIFPEEEYVQQIDITAPEKEKISSGKEITPATEEGEFDQAEEFEGLSREELDIIEESMLPGEYREAELEEIYDLVRGEFGAFNPSRDLQKKCTYLLTAEDSLEDKERLSIEEDFTTSDGLVIEENVDYIKKEYEETKESGAVFKEESDFENIEISEEPIDITDRVVIIEDEYDVDRFVSQFPDKKGEDLKRLLAYLDGLFEKLPEQTIKNFANSEYFDLYVKILNDMDV